MTDHPAPMALGLCFVEPWAAACLGPHAGSQLEMNSQATNSGFSLACREKCLHNLGYIDIFRDVKQTEDEAALQLLPQV